MKVEWEKEWQVNWPPTSNVPKPGDYIQAYVLDKRHHGAFSPRGSREQGPIEGLVVPDPSLKSGLSFPVLRATFGPYYWVYRWRRRVKRDMQYDESVTKVDLRQLLDVPAQQPVRPLLIPEEID